MQKKTESTGNKIYLVCGVAGSGKDTWVNKQIAKFGGFNISRDIARFSLLKPEDDYFAKEDEVFKLWIKNIQNAIDANNGDVYINATHLNSRSRKKTLNELKTEGHEVIAVNICCNLGICIRNNDQRFGRERVPVKVIKDMYDKFILASTDENKIDEVINIRVIEERVLHFNVYE